MIVSKNAYFVDVPKTGSSFVNNCFELVCNDYYWISRNGNRHKSKPTNRHGKMQYSSKYSDCLVFTAIRNPWYFYVSKYIFENKSRQSEDGFNNFMNRMLSDDVGFFTKDIITHVDSNFFNSKKSHNDIKDWLLNTPVKFIGIKNLGQEMADLIETHHDKFDLKSDWKENLEKIRLNNRHMSLIPREGNKWSEQPKYRKLGHDLKEEKKYTGYYSDHISKEVYKKDQAIIDVFGYKFTDDEYVNSIQNTINSKEHQEELQKWK